MTKTFSYLILSLFLFGCSQKEKCAISPTKTITKENTTIDVYDYESIAPMLINGCDDIHIINFWATWCKPCVAELPYFEKIGSEQNIKVTLVSLDMPSMIESKLIPFIEKENLQSDVVLLDDPDANAWIPKVDTKWSGAIPATIIFKNGKRKFYEQSFTYETLNEALNQL